MIYKESNIKNNFQQINTSGSTSNGLELRSKWRGYLALSISNNRHPRDLVQIQRPHTPVITPPIPHKPPKTTITHNFIKTPIPHRMIDVGGQKSERRKWLHVFDNVALVLFIVALAPFDRTDPEEDDKVCLDGLYYLFIYLFQNRLVVSLEIYSSIIQTSHFIHSTIILFLNKKDLFKESIKRVKLTTAFPDYCGTVEWMGRVKRTIAGDNSYEDAIGFIKNKFTEPLTRQKTVIISHLNIIIML